MPGRLRCTCCVLAGLAGSAAALAAPPQSGPAQAPTALPANCLESGDGYLRAKLGGAIEANIDWPNSGTRCQGEPKDKPPGVRLSFQRVAGCPGGRAGRPAPAAGVNVTVIVQGTSRIYGTLGDSRCTVDSLTQRPLKAKGSYRLEARGFCTQPAHAVRGTDAVLVSTFEFAGLVAFDAQKDEMSTSLGQITAR
jgi:hypothetical protein